MSKSKSILITGGAGFIGSHLVKKLIKDYPNYRIVNLDSLTYASNLKNLENCKSFPNYKFIKGDIRKLEFLQELFKSNNFDIVIHLAAESHVDNSINNPFQFISTNIQGTHNLLETARDLWGKNKKDKLFYHISTDEVFGSLAKGGKFSEDSHYDPRSPYSASKAASDHLVRAYYHTYDLPVVVSNCSNNYGPAQHYEKLIPLMIQNIVNKKSLPVYGDGKNIRDWLYVEDHVEAIDLILHKGKIGETYLIGGENEKRNIDLVFKLIKLTDSVLGRPEGFSKKLIHFMPDRPGHDYRYAIDNSKIKEELGWKPKTPFELGLDKTVRYYLGL